MKFRPQAKGRAFSIYALELDNGDCPAFDYLEDLKAADPKSHKRIISVLDHHAEHGPIRNHHISHELQGERYKDVFEFKSRQGARLFYCYLKGWITVLLSGCDKTDSPIPCYEKARRLRNQLMKEADDGRSWRRQG